MSAKNGAIKLVAGNSNPRLAEAIGAYLSTPLTRAVVRRFARFALNGGLASFPGRRRPAFAAFRSASGEAEGGQDAGSAPKLQFCLNHAAHPGRVANSSQ